MFDDGAKCPKLIKAWKKLRQFSKRCRVFVVSDKISFRELFYSIYFSDIPSILSLMTLPPFDNGMPIFKELDSKQDLALVQSISFECGGVVLNYEPKQN